MELQTSEQSRIVLPYRVKQDPKWALAKATQEFEDRQRRKQAQQVSDRAKEATKDTYTWVTQYTETWNEHWVEEGRPSAYEPFPQWPYLKDLLELLDLERIVWLEKSRDLLVSWACVAYLTLNAMTVPRRGVLFQTQKEDKVKQLIKYAKCLYDCQPDWLKEAYPLSKPSHQQPELSLEFMHGGSIVGVPGGADQVRSYHPWGYLLDEASFVTEAGDCYNEALSAVKGKIVLNSSAGPSWYADARRDIVVNRET